MAKHVSSTEGDLKINDKNIYDRVNKGDNDEKKVTNNKGQELDFLEEGFC